LRASVHNGFAAERTEMAAATIEGVAVQMPTLVTERLVVRRFELDDLDACQPILGDAGDPVTVEKRRDWLRWTVDNYVQLEALHQPPYGDRAIALRSDGTLIGACGLVPCLAPFAQLDSGEAARWTPEVGLYYELGPDHRGRGYATEAVRELIRWAGEGPATRPDRRDDLVRQRPIRRDDGAARHDHRTQPAGGAAVIPGRRRARVRERDLDISDVRNEQPVVRQTRATA
jgi:RimJ/RimL family protein N-acetyltransferase